MSAEAAEFYATIQLAWLSGIRCEEFANQCQHEASRTRVRELYRALDTLADQAAAINEPVIRSAQ